MSDTFAERLCGKYAETYGVSPAEILILLKKTVFRVKENEAEFQDSEIVAALMIAQKHDLDPFLREIFLIREKRGGFIVVVSIDGWAKIIANARDFDGLKATYGEDDRGVYCEVEMRRQSVSHPVVLREYMAECRKKTDHAFAPWNTHPLRMLRHKAIMQAARITFGLSYSDPDEAANIRDAEIVEIAAPAKPLQRPNPAEQAPDFAKTRPQPAKAKARRGRPGGRQRAAEPPPDQAKAVVELRVQAAREAASELEGDRLAELLRRCNVKAVGAISNAAHADVVEAFMATEKG